MMTIIYKVKTDQGDRGPMDIKNFSELKIKTKEDRKVYVAHNKTKQMSRSTSKTSIKSTNNS
jgi:hypothetical protein